jgi:predicted RND superfamily exporter protein
MSLAVLIVVGVIVLAVLALFFSFAIVNVVSGGKAAEDMKETREYHSWQQQPPP